MLSLLPLLFALLAVIVRTTAAEGDAAIVMLGPYPGVDVALAPVAGTLKLEAKGTDLLEVTGVITGVVNAMSLSGGWHVHAGFSCSAASQVGGHYFTGRTDPWAVECATPAKKNTPCYQPNPQGVAVVNATISGFSLTGAMPVLGRALVVHNADGQRVGCGVITPAMGEFVSISTYPDALVSPAVQGLLMVSSQSGGGLVINGTLAGLTANSVGGWHIHTGHTCETADPASAIGGHYFPDMDSDPWKVEFGGPTYLSDMWGVATVSYAIDFFSLYQTNPVNGRALVVHGPTALGGPRVGCGVIGQPKMGVVEMGPYPGPTGRAGVAGTLGVTYDPVTDSLTIEGVVTGLQPSTAGGWHVHAGFTCDVAADVGGHYLDAGGADPWARLAYITGAATSTTPGVTTISTTVEGFSLHAQSPVLGRAVVFHNAAGTRIACGLIRPSNGELVRLGSYPLSPQLLTPSSVTGLLLVEDEDYNSGGLLVRGTLAGLSTGEGGWHIHSGYTCEVATSVGGHYFPNMPLDPWTVENGGPTYIANAQGVAQVRYNISAFSLHQSNPVAGRALVIHDTIAQGSGRMGCGRIEAGSSAVAYLQSYPGTANNLGGTLLVNALPSGDIYVSGLISGLNASTSGGWHIHSGFSCDNPLLVGGHYFASGQVDPWLSTRYAANNEGVAKLGHLVGAFSLERVMPTLGRAIVVHNSFGDRVACGLIQPLHGRSVTLDRYPGTNGQGYEGTLVISSSSGASPSLSFRGTLSGLPRESSGGWHIHSGHTCDEAAGVGGHYLIDGVDPWLNVQYTTDARGVATLAPINQPPVAGFSLTHSYPVDRRAIVVHHPGGARVACGLLGPIPSRPALEGVLDPGSSLNPIDVLSAYTAFLSADWIDTLVVWMRSAGLGLATIFFIGAVAIGTVLLIPPSLQALAFGYLWTYAYGGTEGVGVGGLVFICGSFIASALAYGVGKATCSTRFSSANPSSCPARLFEPFNATPLRLLILLRTFPFVPCALLNYYVGACDRFTFPQAAISFFTWSPLAYLWVGLGGAVLKYRLVERGEIDSGKYLPFIWAGFSLALTFMILSAVVVYCTFARATKGPTSTASALSSTASKRASYTRSKLDDDAAQVGVEVGMPPPPPPGPPPDEEPIAEGWREVLADDGELYYFNDDTGESTWDKPTAALKKASEGSELGAPPPPAAMGAHASSEIEVRLAE